MGNIYYNREGQVEGDKMKRAVHMLFILAIVLSGFTGVLTITPSSIGEYTPHDPIHIEGNDDFAEQAASEGWAGDGTKGNPFIIEGYDINASEDDGIIIKSTSVHFIIRETQIRDGYMRNDGIYLRDVQNGTIGQCFIINNYRGVILINSKSNTIVDNWFNSNEDRDIYILTSMDITLTKNTMEDAGISIYGYQIENWNSHNIATNNTVNGKPVYYWKNKSGGKIPAGAGQVILVNCTNVIVEGQEHINTSSGIKLAFSTNNTIRYNNVILKHGYGIYLLNSSGNEIISNQLLSNGWGGIGLEYSNKNNIIGNNISEGMYGIEIFCSMENTIKNNSMMEEGIYINGYLSGHWNSHIIDSSNMVNGNPVYYWKDKSGGKIPLGAGQVILTNCTDVIIENLEITNTTKAIEVAYSSNITVKNNTAHSNEYGIALVYSNHSVLINNDIADNLNGIGLGYSSWNDIISNTALDNQDGIVLWYSEGNILNNNTITDNHQGIHLSRSTGNIIEDNRISLTYRSGIRLDRSIGNDIINNSIFDNGMGITLSDSSDNNVMGNNISNQRSYGINLEVSHNNSISNNIILSNRKGIYLDSSNDSVILNNKISYNRDGIICKEIFELNISYNFVNSSNNTGIAISSSFIVDIIENTVFSNQGLGISIFNSSRNNISLNTVLNNNHGIGVDSSRESIILNNTTSFNIGRGIGLKRSTLNNVTGNVVVNNNDGIELDAVNESILINNQILSNENWGVEISNSRGNFIVWNNISNAPIGIYLWDTRDNVFHHNRFINNKEQIRRFLDNENVWNDNNFEGNYWDDYTGFDTDGDGVGDTKLPHHGVDYYPLTDRQGSAHLDWLFLGVVFITILNITVILVIFILKKRK